MKKVLIALLLLLTLPFTVNAIIDGGDVNLNEIFEVLPEAGIYQDNNVNSFVSANLVTINHVQMHEVTASVQFITTQNQVFIVTAAIVNSSNYNVLVNPGLNFHLEFYDTSLTNNVSSHFSQTPLTAPFTLTANTRTVVAFQVTYTGTIKSPTILIDCEYDAVTFLYLAGVNKRDTAYDYDYSEPDVPTSAALILALIDTTGSPNLLAIVADPHPTSQNTVTVYYYFNVPITVNNMASTINEPIGNNPNHNPSPIVIDSPTTPSSVVVATYNLTAWNTLNEGWTTINIRGVQSVTNGLYMSPSWNNRALFIDTTSPNIFSVYKQLAYPAGMTTPLDIDVSDNWVSIHTIQYGTPTPAIKFMEIDLMYYEYGNPTPVSTIISGIPAVVTLIDGVQRFSFDIPIPIMASPNTVATINNIWVVDQAGNRQVSSNIVTINITAPNLMLLYYSGDQYTRIWQVVPYDSLLEAVVTSNVTPNTDTTEILLDGTLIPTNTYTYTGPDWNGSFWTVTVSYQLDLSVGTHNINVFMEDENSNQYGVMSFVRVLTREFELLTDITPVPSPVDFRRGPMVFMYALSTDGETEMRIYNSNGLLVYRRSMDPGVEGAGGGNNFPTWNGNSGYGREVLNNGVYLMVLYHKTKRLGYCKFLINRSK
ncbi:hypothetical protein ACFL56_01770 [Candidatus Margulisiibacteriota bacterium]